MPTSSTIIVGAQCVVYLNGKPFAHSSGIQYQVNSPHKAIYGIDTLLPLDMVPGQLGYTASMTMYRMRQMGGIEGDGLCPSWDAATRGKYFSLILVDRASSDILFEGQKNIVTQQAWSVFTKQIVTGSVTFTGLFYDNAYESPLG
jgi:hypothetical protein